MGGYAEKLLRLLVCEGLRNEAPGVEYNGSMIADLVVIDPWRADPNYQVPAVVMRLLCVRQQGSAVIFKAWNEAA